MPNFEPDPNYPGQTGYICNACKRPIAIDGSCGCNNPEWNHHTGQKIDPMGKTQVIELSQNN